MMSDTDGTSVSDCAGSDQDILELYRSMPIGLCTFDRKLRFEFINEWLAAINGLSVDDHLGRTLSEILPGIAEGVEAQLRGVIETGEPVLAGTGTVPSGSLPGGEKCFEYSYSPIKSDDGVVLGVSCVVQDVTERKQAEEALRESETRFRTLYENAPVMIDAYDDSGRCVLWNEQCRTTFGWTRDELNDHDDPLALFYPDPATREESRSAFLAKPPGRFEEVRYPTKAGNWIDTMWAIFRLPDGLEFNIGYDITERKKAENALNESKAKLVEMRKICEDVPVVLVSGYSEQELMERSAGLGFSGFLKKPVGNDQLFDMLRDVLIEQH